jgi:hypothetical protein
MSPDTVITHVTQARTDEKALAIARKYPPRIIRLVADQLHIDPDGHGVAWLRQAIVREARS